MGYRKERKGDRAPDPILKLRHARLKAIRVIEKDASEHNGKAYAPKVSIWWEIVDDKGKGEHNGVRFWDNYSLVEPFDGGKGEYVIREETRIGDLASFIAYSFYGGKDYFEDDIEIDFEDLEGAEVIASLEPRRFKKEPATGTRTVSTTLQLASRAEAAVEEVEREIEEDLTEAQERTMHEVFGDDDEDDAAA